MTKYFKANRLLGKIHILRRICNFRKTSKIPLYKGQYEIIEFILSNPGCTQASLAERLMISPASVALSVKRLEKAELVIKETDKDNLRCNKLFATPKAQEAAEKCRCIMDSIDESLFTGFSDDELKHFESYVERIVSNIVNAHFDGKSPDRQEAFAIINKIEEEKL